MRGSEMDGRRPRPARVAMRMAVAAAALAVLAGLAPAAEAAVPPSPPVAYVPPAAPPVVPVETTTHACAGYTITTVNRHDALTPDPPAEPRPGITVTAPDGAVTVRWTADDLFGRAFFGWCQDVTADGVVEVAYSRFSGGDDCCFTDIVIRLEAPETELLRVNLRDTNQLAPRQLDATPALELAADDYRLAYVGGVPFAATSPFPRVFAYRDATYVEATASFPAILRADRKAALRDLAACEKDSPARSHEECRRGVGLRIVGLDTLLKAPTSGISRLPLDLSTRRWLLAMRPQVRRELAIP